MIYRILIVCLLILSSPSPLIAQNTEPRLRSDPPVINSSWDDLLRGVTNAEEWSQHRALLKERYLKLIADEQRPAKGPLNIQVHEEIEVEGIYRRLYISYQVESDERAHAYLGIPVGLKAKAPGVVALHGTTAEGTKQTVGLNGNPDKAFLDHLCRRGYAVIAPEHFVSGERIPDRGAYDTMAFHEKHPNWTAVGKFNFEHSIAVDVLLTRQEVDEASIGVMGHSLGGHGAYFLAAYDERLKACVCNCGASFFRYNLQVEDWSRDRWYVYLKPIRPLLLKGQLPDIDMHEIIALIAPRAYLDVSAFNDGNPLTQRQRGIMLLKIADVYDLVGKPENFSFFLHGRGHSVAHESRELIYGFLDSHLKPENATQTKLLGR